MFEAIFKRARRSAAALLAIGCATLAPAQAQDGTSGARDPAMEQAAEYVAQAPGAAVPDSLRVTAWVDHVDNAHAVSEQLRLFVKASEDAYLTVLNVGTSDRITILIANALQPSARVGGCLETPARLTTDVSGSSSVA